MATSWYRVALAAVLAAVLAVAGGAAPGREQLTPKEVLDLKLRAVARINLDRVRAGLPAVEYDEAASRAGDEHCREILASGVISHWSRDGRKPYMRYSWAGGRDAVMENLARTVGHIGQGAGPGKSLPELVTVELNYMQDGFMAERPPNDGHRRNILNPNHTHVGIGLAFHREGLCYAQEFVHRYVTVEPLPPAAQLADRLTVRGKVTAAGYKLYGVEVYYEPLPQPMSLEELRRTYDYNLPQESQVLRPQAPPGYTYGDGSTGEITEEGNGLFTAPVKFFRGRPGVYTVVVWVQGTARPIPATTISIKVEK